MPKVKAKTGDIIVVMGWNAHGRHPNGRLVKPPEAFVVTAYDEADDRQPYLEPISFTALLALSQEKYQALSEDLSRARDVGWFNSSDTPTTENVGCVYWEKPEVSA